MILFLDRENLHQTNKQTNKPDPQLEFCRWCWREICTLQLAKINKNKDKQSG